MLPSLFFVVIVLVAVFVAIILIDKPIPEWLLPFLFYIQVRIFISRYVRTYFTAILPQNAPYAALYFPETFEHARKYVSLDWQS